MAPARSPPQRPAPPAPRSTLGRPSAERRLAFESLEERSLLSIDVYEGGSFAAAASGSSPANNLIVTGADSGSAPHVRVFNADGSQRFSFFAYDLAFRGGVRVAAGDVTGDGVPDIITAAGPGGGPHVRVFDGATGAAGTGGPSAASSPTSRLSPAACSWLPATSRATGGPTSSPAPAPAAGRTCVSSMA